MNFSLFKTAIGKQFEAMQKYKLFRVDLDKDKLTYLYLASFPAGTNPMFRKRTEYDCSCCKGFIRNIGDVVAIVNGKVVSIWDIPPTGEPAFDAVAKELATFVKSRSIKDVFLSPTRTVGTEKTLDQLLTNHTWSHFFLNIPRENVEKEDKIPTELSKIRSSKDVFLRALTDFTVDDCDTFLDLIAQGDNALYRGKEDKLTVEQFRDHKKAFDALKSSRKAQELYVWSQISDVREAVAHIRSSTVGEFLDNLAKGMDLEGAVRAYEKMKAPANYKRTTAVVTKGMIEKAKVVLDELNLTSALERRHANLDDLTINNLLFANRSTRKAITNSVMDDMLEDADSQAVPKGKKLDTVMEVTMEKFLEEIVPKAESIEILLENQHQANLVSLIAPVDPTAGQLFHWGNNFSWSYNGEFADSIKEKVKAAGGNVTGDLCCRLAWSNHDDLDFHLEEPTGEEIYFSHKVSSSGGRLDVDMNAGGGHTRQPVENIFYGDASEMPEGEYHLYVHNFCKRESSHVGFEVEIDFKGNLMKFSHEKAVPDRERVTVAKFRYTRKAGFELLSGLEHTGVSKTIWGLKTQSFQKVNALMLSPNYWEGRNGNKHYFFMLEGCKNDGTARPFFNEHLREELYKHRKVFEMVGAKMRFEGADKQLSGIGFSSSQNHTLVLRVKGAFTRTLKVKI